MNLVLAKVLDKERREKKNKRLQLEINNKKLYEEGLDGLDTTDMTVRLRDGTELRAHQEVLEGQCDFFRNALKPGTFKESFTRVINLPNDPPRAVRDMIEFFYLFTYNVPSDRRFADLDFADEVFHHLDMLDIAGVYMLDELHKKADRKLACLIRENWPHMKDNMFVVFELLDALNGWMGSYEALLKGSKKYMEAFIEDDVWNKLQAQAPGFMKRLTWRSGYRWHLQSCRGSGMFLDRLGGENAVGMVIRHMKCPACGLVQEVALGLLKPSKIKCRDYGWGKCSGWAPKEDWFDVTKDNQRKNKKKRKAKKQKKEKKVKRKATKKKNSRG